MRYTGKKGWVASYKDTWSVQHTMDPMIVALMERYIEVMNGPKGNYFGVPSGFLGRDYSEEDFKGVKSAWCDIVNEIYDGMVAEEPDICSYDFDIDFGNKEYDEKLGGYPVNISITNQEEYDSYNTVMEEYEERKIAARELFFKHYNDLWW